MLLIKLFLCLLIIFLLLKSIKIYDNFIDLNIKRYNKNIKKIINSDKVEDKIKESNYNNLNIYKFSSFNKIGIFKNNFMNGSYIL